MRRASLILVALALLAPAARAETAHRERVHFEHGSSGTTIRDRIAGGDSIEYTLGARAGQVLQVTLEDRRRTLAFNVFAPGTVPGRDAAVFIGATEGNRAEIRLAASGDFMIQVYQVRAAARRNERADFTLHIAVTGGAGAAAPGPDARATAAAPGTDTRATAAAPGTDTRATAAARGADTRVATAAAGTDARVAGTRFHATGTIPCSLAAGQPMGQCRFGVVRHGAGAAEVTIFMPGGGGRVISFADGRPTGFDLSQADGAARPEVRKEADLFRIAIGAQRFEIPQAVVTGG